MDETPMHIAYEEAKKDAAEINIPVTGSEVVGLVPLEALLGTYRNYRFKGVSNLETCTSRKRLRKFGIFFLPKRSAK